MARRKGARPRTPEELKLIRGFNTALNVVMRQFDADLQRKHRLSHTEYVVLDWLAESSGHTLGLSDLAARCLQSLSAISRTVGRMESRGLVRREQSTRDARAFNAGLTDAGLRLYREATPTHDQSLHRYFIDHLEGIDLEALSDALHRVIAAADNRTTVPSPGA